MSMKVIKETLGTNSIILKSSFCPNVSVVNYPAPEESA